MDEVKKVIKKRAPRKVAPEKQIAAIDRKIAKIKEDADKKIAAIEAEKEALLKPIKAKKLLEEAAKTMAPEEIAEKLGITID
ncbi:hypothetical protein IJG04_00395 [Candidatus Saccharibacteria bacterium]|nr:hypothetical protein [Candidatus Saccharibacteria bacterium]